MTVDELIAQLRKLNGNNKVMATTVDFIPKDRPQSGLAAFDHELFVVKGLALGVANDDKHGPYFQALVIEKVSE